MNIIAKQRMLECIDYIIYLKKFDKHFEKHYKNLDEYIEKVEAAVYHNNFGFIAD